MNDTKASWEKFLNPETLKGNLVASAVFLATYEMLKIALIGTLRDFFTDDPTGRSGSQTSPEYEEKVLRLHKKEIVACAMFFQNWGAIDSNDLQLLKEVTDLRNEVAHELPNVIASTGSQVPVARLESIFHLTSKLDLWWFRNVEATINPELADLSDEQFQQSASLRMVTMELLIEVAKGDDSRLAAIYEMWSAHHSKEPRKVTNSQATTS